MGLRRQRAAGNPVREVEIWRDGGTTIDVLDPGAGGEAVARTSALLLSDIRPAPIARDAFAVPSGYRLREPQITPPVRKRH